MLPNPLKRILTVLLTLSLSFPFFVPQVHGAVDSCSVSVSPTSLNRGIEAELTFTVNNTSSVAIVWVRFTTPSADNFYVEGGSASGWQSTINMGVSNTYSGNTLAPGSSGSFTVGVHTIDADVSAQSWTVEASDDGGGAGATTCTGDTAVAISGDATPPEIDEITLSDLGSSSVKIAWITSEAANSVIQYGTTDAYGSTKTDSSMVTSRSLEITSLSANTTYHYMLESTDAAGNTSSTSDGTFLTAKTGTTTTVTVVVTPTPTPRPGVTPTPTPVLDRTPPSVLLETDFSKPYVSPPEISGKASDVSGISKIEYSLDDGLNWLLVDKIENQGAVSTSFSFTPQMKEDGNYKIKARATDSSSQANIGVSESYTLVIDRLPPQVGGNLVSIGPQVLLPDSNGTILALAGLDQKITLSAVGGPTTIDLLAGKQMFSLVKNPDNGLWSGTLSFQKPGIYTLKAKAVDGAGNKTERLLNSVVVLEEGKVLGPDFLSIKEAVITLYYQEPSSQTWTIWDGEAFGQKNPQKTDGEGLYRLFVPPGTYYLTVKAKGFAKMTSAIFSIDKPTPINNIFTMTPKPIFSLGPLSLPIPDFFSKQTKVQVFMPSIPQAPLKESLTGKEAPLFILPTTQDEEFNLGNLRGEETLLTFISTWSPPSLEQILVLERLFGQKNIRLVVVSLQETLSKVSIFQKRGNYKVPIVVDQDGTLVEKYQINSLPTHFFLDRGGVVKSVFCGVLSEEELEKAME